MSVPTIQRRIGAKLREQRESMNLSQEDFAEQIRMHRTYYSAIERGEKNLTLETLHRVCGGLELEMSRVIAAAEQ